ncbi:ATP synthase subunit C family protein [Gossypium australe]|uniref:ATP synthase subunit 9, mitochondrial n=1 Tax=Gossypium australe TaxID=47621 RepID=A0A5B6TXJ8_9ROSI|nr:ATP synthase subunit C family protein [Gossypium australe]
MSCRGLDMLEGAKSIGAGAATIALAGAAVGIGNVLSSSIHSVARNPSLAKQSFGYAILGFALTEAIALFAPMMAFLISFGSHRKRDTEAPTYLPGRWGEGRVGTWAYFTAFHVRDASKEEAMETKKGYPNVF